jgi:hypothetical protein
MLTELRAKRTCSSYNSWPVMTREADRGTCVAMYATDAFVTDDIPCMRTLPDLVALGLSSSTELGEVKTCLNAYVAQSHLPICIRVKRSYQYEEVIAQESVPGVLGIKLLISIEKDRPLIASNEHCSALQLGLYSEMGVYISTEPNRKTNKVLTRECSN